MTTTVYKLPEYAQHPVAIDLMPSSMPPEEFEAFCEDIQERGVLMPIWVYDGKIIDGWHRYRAAKKTGSTPEFKEYKGKDPAGFVASCNIHRRKLSSLQRALVGAKLHLHHNLTQRQVCKRLGISNEVLSMTVKAVESKVAKIIKRIETDSDFSRSALREELQDAGLLRAKPDEAPPPDPSMGSVFSAASSGKPLTGKEGTVILGEAAYSPPDGEGDDGEDDDVEDLLDEKPSLAKQKREMRKPRETAVQAAVDTFKALRVEEQLRFVTAIWPVARALARTWPTWLSNLEPLHKAAEPSVLEKLKSAAVSKLAPTNKPAKGKPAPPAAKGAAPGRAGATPARGKGQATPLAKGKPAAPKGRAAPARKTVRK